MTDAISVRYDNEHDVKMRLLNSFVRFHNEVYYVQEVNNLSVYLRNNILGKSFWIEANHPELDISSLPPRYIFNGKNSYYFKRPPFRKQKQGICSDNIELYEVVTNKCTNNINVLSYYYYKDNYKLDADIVEKLITKEIMSYPPHPNYCIMVVSDRILTINYKEQFCGYIKLDRSGSKSRSNNVNTLPNPRGIGYLDRFFIGDRTIKTIEDKFQIKFQEYS